MTRRYSLAIPGLALLACLAALPEASGHPSPGFGMAGLQFPARSIPPEPRAAPGVTWTSGEKVMALGKDGRWYFAQVLEVKGDLYRVDMLGVAKEWMDASRMRPLSAEEIRVMFPDAGEPPRPAPPGPAPPERASKPPAPGDPRVASALRSIGIPPETDEDGDYRLTLPVTAGRTQLVWIMSRTQEWGGLEIREVWSPGFRTAGRLDLEMARRLLGENTARKLGAWRIMGTGDRESAVFAVQVEADATGEILRDVLQLVSAVADAMERETVGSDDL